MFRFINSIVLLLFLVPQVSNTVLWINYEINKEAITEAYCVNKAKPELKCEGQCHLAEQLTETSPDPASTQPTEVQYLPQLPLFYEEINDLVLAVESEDRTHAHTLHFYRYSPIFEIEHPPCAPDAA